METNSESLSRLNEIVTLTRRQAIYLAFNTTMVDKLLTYHAQGKIETVRAVLADIEY